jgi:predicted secreted acid phosphatase
MPNHETHRELLRRFGKYLAVAVLTAFCGLFALATANAEDASGCQNLPQQEKLDTKWPINIGLLSDQLIVYRCKDYMNDVREALMEARTWVKQRAPQVVKAAVVFDIDETSLSNWEAMYHNRFGYAATGPCDLSSTSACGQREWDLSARATALEPTLEFFKLVKTLRDKNGDKLGVFFITGRYEDPSERIATQWNLRKEGYDGWEKVFMRPESSRADQFVSTYKTKARIAIENMPEHYTIIANVGDQISDLVGDHADRCFKLPNPFYFIPGDPVPESGIKCLSRQ